MNLNQTERELNEITSRLQSELEKTIAADEARLKANKKRLKEIRKISGNGTEAKPQAGQGTAS